MKKVGVLSSTGRCLATFTRYPQFETTYPYAEPFAGTPYETKAFRGQKKNYPEWMDHGIDGYGQGIGIYRSHRLSNLKVNMTRNRDNIPYYIRRMTQGVFHASGQKLVYRGGKLPDPTRVPVLTGHASPLTGFVHTEKHLIRRFSVGNPIQDQAIAYQGLVEQAKAAFGDSGSKFSSRKSAAQESLSCGKFTSYSLYKPYVALHEKDGVTGLGDVPSLSTDGTKAVKPRVSDTAPPEKKSLRKRFFFMS